MRKTQKNTRKCEIFFAFCLFFGCGHGIRAAGRHKSGCLSAGRRKPVNKAKNCLKKRGIFLSSFPDGFPRPGRPFAGRQAEHFPGKSAGGNRKGGAVFCGERPRAKNRIRMKAEKLLEGAKMKKGIGFFGIAAAIAAIGLSATACGNGAGGADAFANVSMEGDWVHTGYDWVDTFLFRGSNFIHIYSDSHGDQRTYGTFRVSGNNRHLYYEGRVRVLTLTMTGQNTFNMPLLDDTGALVRILDFTRVST